MVHRSFDFHPRALKKVWEGRNHPEGLEIKQCLELTQDLFPTVRLEILIIHGILSIEKGFASVLGQNIYVPNN